MNLSTSPNAFAGPRKNSWVVSDAIDPMLRWELRVPTATLVEVAHAICQLGEESSLLLRVDAGPVGVPPSNAKWAQAIADDVRSALPDFDAVDDGEVRYAAQVTVNVDGSPRDEWSADLGQTLIAVEPGLDATYRRRFCASRPPLALYRDDDDGYNTVLALVTWSDIFSERVDAFPEERAAASQNRSRLDAFVAALERLANCVGGTFTGDT